MLQSAEFCKNFRIFYVKVDAQVLPAEYREMTDHFGNDAGGGFCRTRLLGNISHSSLWCRFPSTVLRVHQLLFGRRFSFGLTAMEF